MKGSQIFTAISIFFTVACGCLATAEVAPSRDIDDVYHKLEQLETRQREYYEHLLRELRKQQQVPQEASSFHNVSDEVVDAEEISGAPEQVFDCTNGSSPEDCYPQDCSQVKVVGPARPHGVYTIYVGSNMTAISVYCKEKEDGTVWLVFQKRSNGSETFYRGWEEYSSGFGQPSDDYWLGLENLHQITSRKSYELSVEMSYGLRDGDALYDTFSVDSAATNYKLHLGNFVEGAAGDSLSPHNGQPFSTKDRDNDRAARINCAQLYYGAWWYHTCLHSNLNGKYVEGGAINPKGMVWKTFEKWRVLQRTEMMIRPVAPSSE